MENNSNNQKPRKNNGMIAKTAIVGVVAGLIGGGISYYGLDQLNNTQVNNDQAQTSISSNSAKVSKNSAKNSGTMTTAYNDVKGAVVSVINLKRQQSSTRAIFMAFLVVVMIIAARRAISLKPTVKVPALFT